MLMSVIARSIAFLIASHRERMISRLGLLKFATRYCTGALLPIGQVRGVRRSTPAEQVDAILRARLGQEVRVQVLRLDADGRRIIVAEANPAGRQLRLF